MNRIFNKRTFFILAAIAFFSVVLPRSAAAGFFSSCWDALCDAAEAVVDAVVDVAKSVLKSIANLFFEMDIMNDEELKKNCKDFSTYREAYQDTANCDVCKIFMTIYDGASAVSSQINSTLGGPLKTLVVTFGLVWIGFETVAFYSGVGAPPDPLEYLTKVGGIFLRVVFGAMFLVNGAKMTYTYFVNPIAGSAMGLANSAMSLTQSGGGGGPGGTISAGDMRGGVKQMISTMASSMAEGQAVAKGLQCGSRYWRKLTAKVKLIDVDIEFPIPNPFMYLFGLWIQFAFWVISVLFCFAMMDTIFRYCLIVAMTPVFIASWVFPPTKGFFNSGKDLFLNTLCSFFVAGIVASLIVVIVEKAWDVGKGNATDSFMESMRAKDYVLAWDVAMENSGLPKLFLISAFLIWGWVLAPKFDQMAGKLMGSSFPESTAIKALKSVIDLVFEIIFAIITIITWGAGSVLYVIKVFQGFVKAAQTVKRLAALAKKLEQASKMMKKVEKMVKTAQKIAKGAKGMAGAAKGVAGAATSMIG